MQRKGRMSRGATNSQPKADCYRVNELDRRNISHHRIDFQESLVFL